MQSEENEMDQLPSKPKSQSIFASPYLTFRERMDRIFDEFARDLGPFSFGNTEFLPHAEFQMTDAGLEVTVELPGLDVGDVDVSVEDRTLTVSGEKKQASETKNGDVIRSERSYGSFVRSFDAPFPLDPAKVEARFDKGVLTIKAAKPDGFADSSRRIEIKH
jgi:HSP20 family protein